jgi:N-glycosylase/DNA lyase
MTRTPVPLPAIENAIREVCSALEERRWESRSWISIAEDELWRELVASILGSRVRFETAHSAVERLRERGLLSEDRRSSHFSQYQQSVTEALSGLDEQNRYPFSRVRAKQIRQAAERLYGRGETIRTFLEASCDTKGARRRLATEVPGLGPKQASLFLRNIGYATHVAVLDTHVLTYMNWVGLTEGPMKSIPTVRKYETLEDTFIEHAYSLGHTPDRFDLAVWVVVRVAREEQKTWG